MDSFFIGISDVNDTGTKMKIKNLILHPNYKGRNSDIALMKLEKLVFLEDSIQKTCLPNINEDILIGSKCYASGMSNSFIFC